MGLRVWYSERLGQERGPKTGHGGMFRELMFIVIIHRVWNWEGRKVSRNKKILWAEAGGPVG